MHEEPTNPAGTPSGADHAPDSDASLPAGKAAKREGSARPGTGQSAPAPRRAAGESAKVDAVRLAAPPAGRARSANWLLLLICCAAALPAMLIELRQPAVFDADEAAVLRRSLDTWNYYAAQGAYDESTHWFTRVTTERLVPYRGAEQQLEDPPGVIWLHETAFLPLGQDIILSPQAVQSAIVRARVVSVIFGLLTIAGVYWAGYSLGGTRTAAFSALICAANVVLIYHAKLATAPIVYCGLAVIAMAGGMWAMRPLRPHASVPRQAIGWMICGVGLGAATLTAGLTAGPAITLPMLTMVLLCPHRLTNLLGLVAAHAIAALVLVPWTLQVHAHNPDIYTAWIAQLWPADVSLAGLLEHVQRRAMIALFILLPWTIWLIGALTQPFSASSAGARQRPFIGMGWFLTAALVMIVMPQPRTTLGETADETLGANVAQMLLLIPIASVLIGQLFSQYAELAASGRYPRIWRLLRWPHLAMIALVTVAAATLYESQQWLIDWHLLADPIVMNPGLAFWLGLGAVLMGLVAISMRYAVQEFPARALVCWSAWSIVLAFVLWIPMARSPAMQRSLFPSVTTGPLTQSPSAGSVSPLRQE